MNPRRPRSGLVVDEIHATLRDRIIAGIYRPGAALSQVGLAADLRVSRTPLREALRRLESENLVVSRVNRGVVVAPLELSDVEASYALRLLIEPALVPSMVNRVTPGDLAAMEDALTEMREPGISAREFQYAHWDFHRIMLGRYPNSISRVVEEHLTVIDRHQRLYFADAEAVRDMVATDAMFLEAVRVRAGGPARKLLEFHLLDAALGMITAADPGHGFSALSIALDATPLSLAGLDDLRSGGRARISWPDNGFGFSPDLCTAHLTSAGQDRRGSTSESTAALLHREQVGQT
ncbi:GntR family transcriptional regulator [Rhodococcus zopfii]|uniref:GntR family transcriptional regulator n=1 Tax=Rhodococcus zopfii TaxID=43772 RepID=UPI001F0ED83F|nr:GntR family transcriptional regulator [Rhodococcus zopfii]